MFLFDEIKTFRNVSKLIFYLFFLLNKIIIFANNSYF